MTAMPRTSTLVAFEYPETAHVRLHAPHGYSSYRSYKPWLRDEFVFRCVYCLTREKWCHDGANGFGVDHLVPKSQRPDLECDYSNLLYLCNRCNCAKRVSSVLDPCAEGLGLHLRVQEDGEILALSREGEHIVDAFNLNYPPARDFRRRKILNLSQWQLQGDEAALSNELSFPVDLPNLTDCRCGNAKPESIWKSFHLLRRKGELPRIVEHTGGR